MFGIEPLKPAYGRDYKSLAKMQIDFDANKDFQTSFDQYINKEDLKRAKPGLSKIRVRYNKLTKTGYVVIK